MDIQKKIADALMKYHGYDRDNPHHQAEWSEDGPSAYTMMLEDAEIALNTILDADAPELGEEDIAPLLGVVTPQEENSSAVTKNAALFIFMETPEGTPTFVKDVREWLKAIDDAGIPDDAEVEGQLYLSYDYTYEDVTNNPSTLTLYNHNPR